LSRIAHPLSGILPEKDIEALQSLIPDLEKAVDTYIIWRTPVEAIYAVLDDVRHPTNASKYHQATLEQITMLDALVAESFEARRTVVKLRDVEERLATCPPGVDRELLEIDKDELLYKLHSLRIRMRDRIRELQLWQDIKDGLDDGSFNTSNRGVDELLSMTMRACMMLPDDLNSPDPERRAVAKRRVIKLIDICKQAGLYDRLGTVAANALKMLSEVQ